MGCLGVHFALTSDEISALEGFADDADRLSYLLNQIETPYFEEPKSYIAESDKSWDGMHRTLSDGRLTWTGGTYPLNHTVLGGKSLYGQNDFIMSLKTPPQVKDIAGALVLLTKIEFRRMYDLIDAKNYDGELSDEDFDYTWSWFQGVRDLYTRAAAENRYVLFTADQ
jgi:hypothetical protein